MMEATKLAQQRLPFVPRAAAPSGKNFSQPRLVPVSQILDRQLKLSTGASRPTQRRPRSASPASAATGSSSSVSPPLEQPKEALPEGAAAITYLEGNSWLVEAGGVRFLIDPILEGPLDFGIPWLYTAYKKVLHGVSVREVASQADCLLVTQSLDDHCHLNTLRPLAELRPDLPVIATPNAQALLEPLFKNVTYLEPGQTSAAQAKGRSGDTLTATVTATPGPVLGPPWQRPENGYILRGSSPGAVSVYLEPHCGFDEGALRKQEQVDVVITPVVKQELPAFTLVSGQEEAVRLVRALRPRFVVPMANAELDAKGILSVLVTPVGTVEAFENLLRKDLPDVQVKVPTPGEPLVIFPRSA